MTSTPSPPSSSVSDTHPLKLLVLGGGTLGALYSYLLTLSSTSIHPTLICRSNYAQVSTNGYILTTTRWGTNTYRPRTIASPAHLHPTETFDYVLVTTKVPNTPSFPLSEYSAHITTDTLIIILQNGVGIEEPYARAFPENTVVSGVVYIVASQPRPGEVLQVGNMERLFLGLYGPACEDREGKLRALIESFCSGGSNAKLHGNIQYERWRKLTWNGCFNTLCAITGLNTAELLGSSEEMVAMVKAVVEEIVNVAKSVGIDLGSGRNMAEFQVERTKGLKPFIPSLLQDAAEERELEVEGICGNVWRMGEREGVEVGRLKSVYAILVAMNHRFKNSTKM